MDTPADLHTQLLQLVDAARLVREHWNSDHYGSRSIQGLIEALRPLDGVTLRPVQTITRKEANELIDALLDSVRNLRTGGLGSHMRRRALFEALIGVPKSESK